MPDVSRAAATILRALEDIDANGPARRMPIHVVVRLAALLGPDADVIYVDTDVRSTDANTLNGVVLAIGEERIAVAELDGTLADYDGAMHQVTASVDARAVPLVVKPIDFPSGHDVWNGDDEWQRAADTGWSRTGRLRFELASGESFTVPLKERYTGTAWRDRLARLAEHVIGRFDTT